MPLNPDLLAECLTEHPDLFDRILAILEYDEQHIFGYDEPKKGVEPWVFLARATLGVGIIKIKEPKLNLEYYALIKIPDEVSKDVDKGWPTKWVRGDITSPAALPTQNKHILKTSHSLSALLDAAGEMPLKAKPPSKPEKHEGQETDPFVPRDKRQAPDSYAETDVLTPKERRQLTGVITKGDEAEIRRLSTKSKRWRELVDKYVYGED